MPWGLVILLLIGLVLAWALGVVYTLYLLTHPPRRTYAWAVSRNVPGDPSEMVIEGAAGRGLAFTSWNVRSRGLDLPVWDITGLDPNGPTIIITHGWADSRIVMLSRVQAIAAIAARIIVWDLPGQGAAPGGCTIGTREVDDLLALMDASGSEHVSKCVLWGFSLGAGVSIAAAVRAPDRVRAMIAEAPYRIPPTPARNVLRLRALPHVLTLPAAMAILGMRFGHGLEWLWPALTRSRAGNPKDRFDRALLAAQLPENLPLLVLHGGADPVCPPQDGREIADAAGRGTYAEIPGGGHNTLWVDPAMRALAWQAVRDFLRTNEPRA